MADAFTPNLNLTKPGDGESEDTWGQKLNGNFDTLDGLFGASAALLVSKGGTGGTTQAEARTGLGLGTIATQNADNVAITGGSIDGQSFVRAVNAAGPRYLLNCTGAPSGNRASSWVADPNAGTLAGRLYDDAFSSFSTWMFVARSGNNATQISFGGPLTVSGSTVWHAGNDGAGSTLDADLLDGQQGTFYTNASNMASGNLPVARLPTAALRNQGQFTSGSVTISNQVASGTPGAGDLWIQYV